MRFWREVVARGLIALALTAGLATAASSQTIVDVMNGAAPWWVLRGTVPASLDFDFANGRYYQAGTAAGQSPGNLITTSRASVAYEDNLSGLWAQFAANTLRVSNKGALIEEARTNDALWARDVTQASWTKVGMGTALNAVGIDGTANSATTLTATGTTGSCTASCTALQAITLGSQADTYSVFLKRVTGSGAVNVTINNLSGVTACTLSTTAFTRCSVTATLANPTVGIQLTAVGDVVVADFNQMEPGGFATSPILTTTVAATRAADVVTVTAPPPFGPGYTLVVAAMPNAPTSYAATQIALEASDGTVNNRFFQYRSSSTGIAAANNVSGGSTTVLALSNAWTTGTLSKVAAATASGSQRANFAGTAGASGSGSLPVSINKISIGTRYDGALSFWDGYIIRITMIPDREPDLSVKLLASP